MTTTRRRAKRPRGYSRGEVLTIVAAAILLSTGAYVSAQTEKPIEARPFDDNGEAIDEEQRPDPQECKDVQKQMRDQLRDLTRIEKLLMKAKLTTELETLGGLRGKLTGYQANIKAGCTRDAIQEFYDEQVWETVNELRAKAELPKQIAEIERELKRLEKQATDKTLTLAGLNIAQFRANVGIVKQALADAKSLLVAGTYQEAQESLQPIWDGMHPGEMSGVLYRLRDFGREVKKIKDAQVRAQLQEVVAPIIEAANEGDFREANQALNDVHDALLRIIRQMLQSRKFRGGNIQQKLDQLEDLIGRKFDMDVELSPPPVPETMPQPMPVPPVNAPINAPINAPAPTVDVGPVPFLGGWGVEKVFGLDAQQLWSESAPVEYRPTYIEFNRDGTMCTTETAEQRCATYNQYTVNGDTITMPGAASSRLKWSMPGEKLEIVHEGLKGDAWTPTLKITSVKVR